jgi:hypothetical protein
MNPELERKDKIKRNEKVKSRDYYLKLLNSVPNVEVGDTTGAK